jgi:hypothetical protein
VPDQAATNVYVDLSFFTMNNSFGHINGDMLLPSVPVVGEIISFTHPESSGEDALIGSVHVEHINHVGGKTALMLSDVFVGTKDDAFRVSRYLEGLFGLFANIHDEDDLRTYMERGQGKDS